MTESLKDGRTLELKPVLAELPAADQRLVEKVIAALAGQDPDQRRIAQVGLDWITLILAKNADYGSAVWKQPVFAPDVPVEATIRVRMSDKVQRIMRLLEQPHEVKAETVEDSFDDLGAYCLLRRARPRTELG